MKTGLCYCLVVEVSSGVLVPRYTAGPGSIRCLSSEITVVSPERDDRTLLFVDSFFKHDRDFLQKAKISSKHNLVWVETGSDLTTDYVDLLATRVRESSKSLPSVVVGIGGGTVLDVAKAVSCLLTNPGNARDYQGWDLLNYPGIPKIAVPTLPGTGAESSRTAVLTNPRTGLKLGMNSDYSLFDSVIMDPELSDSVPKNLLFISASDAFFHSIEILSGSQRRPLPDSLAREAFQILQDVFGGSSFPSTEARGSLGTASFLAGAALAGGTVGMIHPFSAGLSVVLRIPHTLANCIAMRAMEPFYPEQFQLFWTWVEKFQIDIPMGVCSELGVEELGKLFDATIRHSRPLENHLGKDYLDVLTKSAVFDIFRAM